MKILCKIDDGKNDGDSNNLTGTTSSRGFLIIGDWSVSKSVGLFHFSLPVSLQKLNIKNATFIIYIENYKSFAEEEKTKPVQISIDISNEKNAKSLEYGGNRIFISEKKYFKKLETNSFIKFNISEVLEKSKADKNLLLRIKINNVRNQLWKISSADYNTFGAAEIIIETDELVEIEENTKISDEIICKDSDYEKGIYKVGDLILHPSHITTTGNSNIGIYTINPTDNFQINISEKIKFGDAIKFLDIVGKQLPFFTPDEIYNCIVESCSLSYNISWIDLTLNLIIL